MLLQKSVERTRTKEGSDVLAVEVVVSPVVVYAMHQSVGRIAMGFTRRGCAVVIVVVLVDASDEVLLDCDEREDASSNTKVSSAPKVRQTDSFS